MTVVRCSASTHTRVWVMKIKELWKRRSSGVSDVVIDDAPVVARVLLELNGEFQVLVSALDDNGCITHSVSLGELTQDPFQNKNESAEALAQRFGWLPVSEWFTTEETAFIDLAPKPITVTFVGNVIPDEEAVRLARNAGLEVLDVTNQNYIESEGKNYISFNVETPRGWSW